MKSLSRSAAAAFAACVVASKLAAQPASPAGERVDDAVVSLSPFDVKDSADGSYAASDSLTASRVRTDIKDLPYNVNVVTSEFIRDFAALNLTEELAYTSSFSYGQNADTDYALRGMLVNTQLRNGFRAEVFRNSVNTERVEVIKGPAAAIYGQASPGGLINTITKKPKSVFGGAVRFSVGNSDYRRGEIELTGPLSKPGSEGWLKDTSYLVTLSAFHKDTPQDFAYDQQIQTSISLRKKFGPHTTLSFEGEYLYNRFQRQVTVPGAAGSTVSGVVTPAHLVWKEIYSFQPSAPGAYDDRPQKMGFLSFEHQFNRVLSLRLGGNASKAPNDVIWFYTPTNTILENPLRFAGGRQPVRNVQARYTHNAQLDLLAQYQTGKVKHQTLFTLDHSFFRSERTDSRLATTLVNNPAYNVPTLFVDSPNYFMTQYDPTVFTALSAGADNRTWIYGAFLRQQLTAFDGRLIAMAAVRYDYNKFNLRNPLSTTPADVFNREAVSPQFGLNFKVTDAVILYASRSQSFIPPTSGSNPSQVFGGERPKNQRGVGYEVGVKASLLNNALNFTLAGYDIRRRDVAISLVDQATGTAYTVFAGEETSKGAEIDFNWKVAPGLQWFGGYGHTDTEIADAGRDLDAIGRRPRSTPNNQGGTGFRWAVPKNVLEGLVLTAGVTYIGDFNAYAPLTGGIVGAGGIIRSNDGLRNIVVPSYTLWNAGASYTFRTGGVDHRRYVHRVQANFKNLFDDKYVATNLRTADGFTYIFGYAFSF